MTENKWWPKGKGVKITKKYMPLEALLLNLVCMGIHFFFLTLIDVQKNEKRK